MVIENPTENVVITLTVLARIKPQSVSSPFKYGGLSALDIRTVLSKEQMTNMQDTQMPDKYFAICTDDAKLYIYDKSANVTNSTTGKFKPIDNLITFDTEEAKENFEEAIEESSTVQQLTTNVSNVQTWTTQHNTLDDFSGTVDGGVIQ